MTIISPITLGSVNVGAIIEFGLVKQSIGQLLKIDVNGFRYDIGGYRGVYSGAVSQSVDNNDTSWVWLDSAGVLHIDSSVSDFPDDTHIALARVVTSGGEIVAIYEERTMLASSSSSIGTCVIPLPVDGDIKGGDVSASSNNNWAAIRYDDTGADGEGRNRLVRRTPKNYLSGDLVLRIVYSLTATIGNNKDSFWRLSYKFASLGEDLGTMSSVTALHEHDSELADRLYSITLTIPEANVDMTKDMMALYLAREHDDAQDNLGENIYVHQLWLEYTGRLLAGQAGQ